MTVSNDRPQYTVGVDFGTLSGRAVVVRVSDGAELGSAVHDVPPRGGRRPLPGHRPAVAAGLGAAGAGRLRRVSCDRRAGGDRGGRRGPGRRHRRRPPTSPPAPCCRPPPTARRCASCRSSPTGPHAYAKLWKHHAAQPQADRINDLAANAGEPWLAPLRRPDLQRVGVRQGAAGARGGPGGVRGDRALGRGGRLDRLAADRASTSATRARPVTRASARTGSIRRAEYLARAATRRSPTSRRQAGHTRSAQLGARGRDR